MTAATVASARRPRRTQAERSATTQVRLLDATIDCLVDYGYAGTTVARVAQRAGVTRGAQIHHFPTKELLVLAAVRRLNERRSREVVECLDGLAASADWLTSLLDLLWELHRGPVFVATAEIWLAARNDPQLASHMKELEQLTRESIASADTRAHPQLAEHAVLDAVYTAMDAMRGLVMSSWHLPEAETNARWQRLKRHLLLVFP